MRNNTTDLRLLLPESIWLEPEQFDQARAISQATDEAHQWQAYLNALALFGFEQWLGERLPEYSIHQELSRIETAGCLQIGEFKLCLLAIEHSLDEVVSIPQVVLAQPELASHFYVLLEIAEEEEQAIIRGFLRYDQLIGDQQAAGITSNEYCSLPLSWFDSELNHLLFNCRFLEPAAIPLPERATDRVASSTAVENSVRPSFQAARIKLSQWLEGVFDATWQAIDALIDPTAGLALSTRNSESTIKRGKLIDLGMQLGSQTFALLLTVTPEAENKMTVLVQLHPTSGVKTLPPHLKLTLVSKLGKVLQEVESRHDDSYIQLLSFRGEPGKCFSVGVSLGDSRMKEDFEL